MTLSDNWQCDQIAYQELESSIQNIFVEQLKILGCHEEDWTFPFFNKRFGNGQRFMDGNPIFSTMHKTTSKIIKVVIDDDQKDFTVIKSKFDDKYLLIIMLNTKHIEPLSTIFRTVLLINF